MCENTLPLNLNVRIVGIERIDVNDITARGIGEPIQKANPLVYCIVLVMFTVCVGYGRLCGCG